MRSRWLLLAGSAIAAGAASVVVWQTTSRDSAPTILPASREAPRPGIESRKPRESGTWPTYGFDPQRTHVGRGLTLRPPFRKLWTVHDNSFFEGPPVVAYGRVYVGTNHGRVIAVKAASGEIAWEKELRRCIAASPAVGGGAVYVGVMAAPPCRQRTSGFVVALDADTGRVRWKYRAGPVESPPLLVGGRLYFGSWDGHIYAVDAASGRLRWRFATGGKVKSGAAFANGTIYIGSYDGHLYALDAATGALRWSARGGEFYATPTVAYGRVFVGSIDGRVFAFHADNGKLAWSVSTASHVYSAAAVWRRTVFVGSYDHHLYALHTGNGEQKWKLRARSPISGAPTVLAGLVYFSTCGSCSKLESDPSARRSYAADTRTGRLVWSFADGEYSPVVADAKRVYLMGFTSLYGLAPKPRRP